MRVASRHSLSLFFALAYIWAWPFMFWVVWFQAPVELAIPASFGPAIAAVLTHRLSTGRWRAFRFFCGWRRCAAAGIAAVFLTLVAFVALPGVLLSESPQRLNWSIFASLSVHNYSTLLGGPLGEEPGWRGYALPRLEQRFGPVGGWLVLSGLWTFWHLPMFWAASWSHPPFGNYLLLLIALCLILNFSTNVAGFAVIPAILGHAAFNTTGQYFAGLFADAEVSNANAFWRFAGRLVEALGVGSLTISVNEVAACCALAVALLVLAATKGRLGYPGAGRKL
jgi:membrane protease YdiL (CAAX protease family)